MATATDKTIGEKLGTPDRKPEAKSKSITPTAKRSRRLPSSFLQLDGAAVTPSSCDTKTTPKNKGKKKGKPDQEATGEALSNGQIVVKEKRLGCFGLVFVFLGDCSILQDAD